MVFALIGVSVPSFWLALLLIIEFSVKRAWLPAMGIGGLEYYILPGIAGSLGGIAGLARQTRSSMLDVIRSDYITTARAKGVSERNVVVKHALKNALIPVITYLGPQIAFTLSGGMVVEQVFSIPGLGRYFIQSIQNRDYPIIMGTTLFLATFIIFMNLVVDLCYKLVDPRINLAKGGN